MKIIEIKKKLKNYIMQEKKLSEIKEKYLTLKEKIISIQAQTMSDMPLNQTFNKNKILDGISNIEQLNDRMMKQQEKVMEMIYEVEDIVNLLECERLKQVLEFRYFKQMKWEVIGRKMFCDKRTAQRLHGQALKEIEGKYK